MIKTFLFDYGGVMNTLPADGNVSNRLSKITGLDKESAFSLIKELWVPFSKGSITEEVLWEDVEKKFGKAIPKTMRDIWNKWEDVKPSKTMIDLINSLRNKGYTVGLVSNSFPPTAHDIRKHGGYDMFDFTVISCEVGYVKPEKEIFLYALHKAGDVKSHEVVFIDDQKRCIEGAEQIGIIGILAKSPVQIKTSVSGLIKKS